MTHSTRDWNATSYERVAAPVQAFGERLLDRLELSGDETVLDAGCGTGAVTELLVKRLPRGRVIAVDGSSAMVAQARARLGGRAEVALGDLLELELGTAVDAVFSSATFHWIADHERLYRRLFAALAPGGRLVAQCGGEGNIAELQRAVDMVSREAPFAEHLNGWEGPWNFSSPERARRALGAAGFVDVHAGLHDEPVTPPDAEEFLSTMILGAHLDRLPADRRAAFVARVAAALAPPPTIRYVRLTLRARRPA